MKIKVELGYCERDKERVRDKGGKSTPPLTLSFQFREQLNQGLQAWLYGMSTSTTEKKKTTHKKAIWWKKKKRSIKRTITMNKTTYANFYGVVNVFLGVDCVNSALNVGSVHSTGPPAFLILSCIECFATWKRTSCPCFHPWWPKSWHEKCLSSPCNVATEAGRIRT